MRGRGGWSFTGGVCGGSRGEARCGRWGTGIRCRLVGDGRGIAGLVTVMLVLYLLEVLLARSHLRILQLLHVECLTISQELLSLILQLHTHTQITHTF